MKNDIDYMEFLREQNLRLQAIGSRDVRPKHVMPGRRLRHCLKCHEGFRSEGPGNHICGYCNKKNAKPGKIAEVWL